MICLLLHKCCSFVLNLHVVKIECLSHHGCDNGLIFFIQFYLKMDIQLWVIYSHWPIFFAVFMKCLISTALYSNSKNTALHFDFIACLRHHNACSLLFLIRWIFICMHQRYLRSALANIHIYTIEGNRTAFVSNQATFLYL